MEKNLKKAVLETALAAVVCTVFYLFSAAIFAVIVKAYAPPQSAVTAVNWVIKGVGAFLFCLIFVHAGKAVFKGAAAGAAACIFTMLLFGAIGGFHVTAFFPLELLFSAALGALGALAGVKIRKETR